MKRREFLAGGSMAASLPAPGAGRAGRPKNVLWLMADQHKPGALGVNGDPVARTPNLDALARSGTSFDGAYCTSPVCVPSRASLLTGLYPHRHGAYNNSRPWPFEIQTAAHHFNRAGYMTAFIGKMHSVDAQTHGFDYRLDFNDWFQTLGPRTAWYAEEVGRGNIGSVQRLGFDAWKAAVQPDGRQGPVHVGRVSRLPEEDDFEAFVGRESVRFLENNARRPFFLVSSFHKPHDPFMPAERFARMFPPEEMALPSTWGKVDLETVPGVIRQSIRRCPATPELADPNQARRRIAFYYGSLAQMDYYLGQVLDALRKLGLEQDTIVLYNSDHGEMLGEHGLWLKFVMYESSVRVPLIFRVPGLTPADARCAGLVSLVQLLPTLLELCALPVPAGLDGPSLVPQLREPARRLDAAVFAEHAAHARQACYMARHGDYKYIHWVNDLAELYNLREDPLEMKNLAAKPDYSGCLSELKQRLLAWNPGIQ